MRVLITGNMGYVGPALVRYLRQTMPGAYIAGLDVGYFGRMVTGPVLLPESRLDAQFFGDVRSLSPKLLEGYDALICLSAISNDPIGNRFEDVTRQINAQAVGRLGQMAREAGITRFILASSCSVYGFAADGAARTEIDALDPLTAYARSKVEAEQLLEPLAGSDFMVTCHRFATACGFSERLRLDLVLNDFVAGALSSGTISILSDGTPWRPLINVEDMALAMHWSLTRGPGSGGRYLIVNTGADEWNYRVIDLAEAVARALPGTRVTINADAPPDRRSYRVDFGLYRRLAPGHQPRHTLEGTITDLVEGLRAMGFNDAAFRDSELMRLKVVERLERTGQVDDQLQLTGL